MYGSPFRFAELAPEFIRIKHQQERTKALVRTVRQEGAEVHFDAGMYAAESVKGLDRTNEVGIPGMGVSDSTELGPDIAVSAGRIS